MSLYHTKCVAADIMRRPSDFRQNRATGATCTPPDCADGFKELGVYKEAAGAYLDPWTFDGNVVFNVVRVCERSLKAAHD